MKKLLTTLCLIFCSLSVIANNGVANNTTTKTNNEIHKFKTELSTLRKALDSVNIANAHKVDSLNKIIDTKYKAACDEFRGHCTAYYDRLDNEMDRTLTKFSIIWGVIGVIFGIVMPLILNRIAECRFNDDMGELRNHVRSLLTSQDRVTDSR